MPNPDHVEILNALTPTEYLMMEVMTARYRLGEWYWSFPSSLRPAARRLEARNLASWKGGILEKTILVSISDLGKDVFLSDTYVPPIESGV